MQDYDRIIWAFLQGWVDDEIRAVEPARIGMVGGSHGGMTTMYYGRHTSIPAATGQPLALWLPAGASPDLASWYLPGFDDGEDPPSSFGALRLSGFPAQYNAYQGDYLDDIVNRLEAGNEAPESFIVDMVQRSAYDLNGGVQSLLTNVAHGLISMSSLDCRIPKSGAFELYQQLREVGAGDRFRLVSPLGYHGCQPYDDVFSLPLQGWENGGDRGYYPKWTAQSQAAVAQYNEDLRFAWISEYVLDQSTNDLNDQPPWLFMLADEANEPGEIPSVYQSLPPGEAAITDVILYLGQDGRLGLTAPTQEATWTVEHVPQSGCTGLNLTEPCAPTPNLGATLMFVSAPIPQDVVIAGNPLLTIHAQEQTSVPYSFTVTLADVPDPSQPQQLWPVTSERVFDHTNSAGFEPKQVALDMAVHRFAKGHAIMLVITSESLPVDDYTMFAPSFSPYHLELKNLSNGAPATLMLPALSGALDLAPDSFQTE